MRRSRRRIPEPAEKVRKALKGETAASRVELGHAPVDILKKQSLHALDVCERDLRRAIDELPFPRGDDEIRAALRNAIYPYVDEIVEYWLAVIREADRRRTH